MPMDKSRYPDNWREISERIRYERAGNKCEWCGVPNDALILRSTKDGSRYLISDDDGEWHTPDGEFIPVSEMADEFDEQLRMTRVILTVAHLGAPHADGTPGDKHDKMDVRDENLAALCQRCHLLYDMDEHVENRRRTRLERARQEKREQGQMELFEDE